MKKTFYFTATAMMLTITGLSQKPGTPVERYKKKEFTLPSYDSPIILADTSFNRVEKLREAYLFSRLSQVRAQPSHKTVNGDVYLLSPDNMPCLVPDKEKTASMPNGAASKTMPENMPNAYPKRKLIPGKQK